MTDEVKAKIEEAEELMEEYGLTLGDLPFLPPNDIDLPMLIRMLGEAKREQGGEKLNK